MPERSDTDNPARDLTAFADGNLDPARSADVLEYLSQHPDVARTIARSMRFRGAVGRSIAQATPTPSNELRDRVSDMVNHDAAQQARRERSPFRVRRQVWMLATAASLLFVMMGLGFGKLIFGIRSLTSYPVPADLAADITHVHVDCSRAPSEHNLPFPRKLGELIGPLKKAFGRPVPYPDLNSIGYQYIGAGPCSKPTEGTVHLLYQSTKKPIVDTVSLFVQGFHEQIPVEEGKVYWAQQKNSSHPMLVWRSNGLLFFLVGDAEQPVRGAAEVMHAHVPL